MGKHGLSVGLGLAALAGFAAYAAWAFFITREVGGGWRSLLPIWPYVLGGVLAVAALAGALLWLVFYSARHGYDDRIDPEGR